MPDRRPRAGRRQASDSPDPTGRPKPTGVEIQVCRDSRSRLSSFLASGHAGWSESEDIVCAAVSVLVQSAVLGLTEIAEVPVETTRGDGRLALRLQAKYRDREDVRAIVETMVRSLHAIAAQYPAHVRITESLNVS